MRPINARRPDGIFIAPFEAGEIGPELFRAACRMGLEGLGEQAKGPAASQWARLDALDTMLARIGIMRALYPR